MIMIALVHFVDACIRKLRIDIPSLDSVTCIVDTTTAVVDAATVMGMAMAMASPSVVHRFVIRAVALAVAVAVLEQKTMTTTTATTTARGDVMTSMRDVDDLLLVHGCVVVVVVLAVVPMERNGG